MTESDVTSGMNGSGKVGTRSIDQMSGCNTGSDSILPEILEESSSGTLRSGASRGETLVRLCIAHDQNLVSLPTSS